MIKYLSRLMLVVVLVVTGCGVPQEEHDAAVAQLQTERANVEATLNGKISDLESVVKSEKAKGKSMRLQLDSTERKLRESQKKAISDAKDMAKVKAQVTSLERDESRRVNSGSNERSNIGTARTSVDRRGRTR